MKIYIEKSQKSLVLFLLILKLSKVKDLQFNLKLYITPILNYKNIFNLK
jgi:hypothetical protein